MISIQEAEDIILSHVFQSVEETIPLELALGRVLFSDLKSDTDLPPFDRVMMDGIAIRFADWQNGQRRFPVHGVQQAGETAKVLAPESALEVMTGAICPQGADCIVPYEEIELTNEAFIQSDSLKMGQHIHTKGSDKKQDDVLVKAGTKLNAVHLMIAASAGNALLVVHSQPRIHVFSTGNELVEIDQSPTHFQIRRSNVYGLKFLLEKEGLLCSDSHIMDDKDSIAKSLEKTLQENDVILLSGGVSKGKFDFIPEILQELGIEKLFHGVAQKPGKPFWFGQGRGKLVFAFPGNPVSTMVCATRYLIPWLRVSFGQKKNTCSARLTKDIDIKGKLPYFIQVRTYQDSQGVTYATASMGAGSGDYANLTEVHGFAKLEAESGNVPAGKTLEIYLFDS